MRLFRAERGALVTSTLALALVSAWAVRSEADPSPTTEDLLIERVNEERWTNGQLPPLKHDALLDQSSELHSRNMADRDFFGHCDLDEHTMPWDRMSAAGYAWIAAAENIAAGYSTVDGVMTGWMNSSGHRANILSTTYREIGAGFFQAASDAGGIRIDNNSDCTQDNTGGPYYNYWTQDFGKRNNVYPVVIEREVFAITTRDVDLYLYGTGWASEMRLCNESGGWTDWMPFARERAWQLSPFDGTKTVTVELMNGSIVRSASDTIELMDQGTSDAPDEIVTARSSLRLYVPTPSPIGAAGARVRFELDRPSDVRLILHEASGREVVALTNGSYPAGVHEIAWTPGSSLARGTYFLRLSAGSRSVSRKVLFVR